MNLPNFHDGFLDGFLIADNKSVRLFLKTENGSRYTVVLHGVEALKIWDVRQGNIIFDVSLVGSDQLTESNLHEVYDISHADDANMQLNALLGRARHAQMQFVELTASYGAQCAALFRSGEIEENYRWS